MIARKIEPAPVRPRNALTAMPRPNTTSAQARPVCRLVPSGWSSQVRRVPRQARERARAGTPSRRSSAGRAASAARAVRMSRAGVGPRAMLIARRDVPVPRVPGAPQIARAADVRAVLDDRVAPPGGVGGGDGRCLRLRRGVGDGLRGERVGVGGAALPRPVPGARQEQGEDRGEGQHPAVVQHGEEHSAADQREEHGRQRLAVHAAGEELAHLVLLLVVVRDEEPGEAVEDEAEAAGRGEHREHDPEDHRVHVAVPPEPGAHPAQHLVPPVAPELARDLGRRAPPGWTGLPGVRGSPGARGSSPAGRAPAAGTASCGSAPGIRSRPGRSRVPARRGVLVICHVSMVTAATAATAVGTTLAEP